MKSYIKKNSGLTLVELIVVVAIIAIMAGSGGFGLSLMIGAEARRAASNMDIQLNDIKTGTMTRAGETVVLRYIEESDDSKEAGVDKDGYYLVKTVSTIMNTKEVKEAYTDPEYCFIGNGRVKIVGIAGGEIKTDGTNGIQFEYNRRTGVLDGVKAVTVAGTDYDATVTEGGEITLSEMTFTSGYRTYTIKFDSVTGRHELIR